MQMVTVMRTGTVFQIPKKLSHHVPRVPILDTSTFFEKTPWKWYNIDMDQFQLYKKAETLIYSISEVAAMNIVSNSDAQVCHTFTIENTHHNHNLHHFLSVILKSIITRPS